MSYVLDRRFEVYIPSEIIKDKCSILRVFDHKDYGPYQADVDAVSDRFFSTQDKIGKVEMPVDILMLAFVGAGVFVGGTEDMSVLNKLLGGAVIGGGALAAAKGVISHLHTQAMQQYITDISAVTHGIGFYWDKKPLRKRVKEKFVQETGDGYNDYVFVVNGEKLVNPDEVTLCEAIVGTYIDYVVDSKHRTDKPKSKKERERYIEYIESLPEEDRAIYVNAVKYLNWYYNRQISDLKTKKKEATAIAKEKGKPLSVYWTEESEQKLNENAKDVKSLRELDELRYFDHLLGKAAAKNRGD